MTRGSVDAFFEPDGDVYVGTAATAGPWDPSSMHFGPPAALLAREVEAQPTTTPKRVARVTFEILRPVPVGPVAVRSRMVRGGGRIDLIGATLTASDGTELALCRAWRIRTAQIDVPATARADGSPSGPDQGAVKPFFAIDADVHYGTSMETRFVSGGFLELGPAVVWMRMRMPLVAGEAPSPLTRVVIAADSGNGVSSTADPRELLFVNTDLTVHLHRHPIGEWVCLRARTVVDDQGSGLTTTGLADTTGAIGTALQSLFVQQRG